MTETQKQILEEISGYMNQNPGQRFAQELFNLDITQFKPSSGEVRDIFYDTDEVVLERIRERIVQFKEPK
jgi:hypothetical protein